MFGFGKQEKSGPAVEKSDADMLREARAKIEGSSILANSPEAFALFDRYNDKGELTENGESVDILDKLGKLEARLASEGAGATPAAQMVHGETGRERKMSDIDA